METEEPESERQKIVREYKEAFANPYVAAARGYVDEVIRPEETKAKIVEEVRMLRSKKGDCARQKHGNMPV